MTKANVAHIVFRAKPVPLSSILNTEEATHRNFHSHYFDGGMIVFYWENASEILMYPVDTIKSISITTEEE